MGFQIIDRKVLAGVILCALILLTIVFISFLNNEKFKETNRWVNHTQEVLFDLEQVLVHCIDAETGERGYIITGNEAFLEPYQNARAELFKDLDKVKALTKDNAPQQDKILHIQELATHLTGFLSACIDARRTAGFEKAREMVITGTAKSTLDNIRAEIAEAKQIEEALLDKRKQKSETDAGNFNLISVILIITIVIVLAFVCVIIIANFKRLAKAQKEAMEKNLILEKTSELIKAMQGDKRVTVLAQTIISFLANFTNAQIGAFYIAEDHLLKMTGAFGIDLKNESFPYIRLGEGLAGQAAVEKATLFCTNIPNGHFNLNTAFGKIVPKSIIAFPFIFEGNVAGVIELGSLYDLHPLHKELLSIVGESIAIAVTAAQARENSKILLEETLRQAEELEVQQEALKRSNDELYAKTKLLEESGTELKAQQEELQHINEALATKAKELEQAGRYKSEFLANMSHELRTPLNSILILSQLMAQNKNNVLAEKEQKYAQSIHTSGSDLLNLINEVLDLSKVEAGKMELEITPVPIDDLVEEIHTMFNEIAKVKSVEFKIVHDAEKAGHSFQTDKQRLEQILRNFLSNAFKFTPPGGTVTLSIKETEQGANNKPGMIAFSVTDSGIGIPASKQEIIFEAFQQADGSTKRKYGGTGLGLSISKQLAQALGGEIILQSEEDKGSTFTLLVPLTFDAAATVPAPQNREVNKPASHKIDRPDKGTAPLEEHAIDDRYIVKEHDNVVLIIGADADLTQKVLALARKNNYKAIMATQENTGISFARYYRPCIIFLDLSSPELGGTAVLKKLKIDPALRHIPILVFSDNGSKKDPLESGAFDFIEKPVTQTTLEAAFDRSMEFLRKKVKKLLIVEDNREQNQSIKELIGNSDVKSFSAYKGTEAYDMMLNEKYDCIIVDLHLPDMSGVSLMEKMKANKELEKIPVIVYTGKDLTKEEMAQLNRLANTVILKTANSMERLLDETVLLLHRAESNLPQEKRQMIRSLHGLDEVLKNRTVLIVDDDMRNIYSLVNALEEEGLICLNADNGREAINKLEKQADIDMVLMDLMMPEMDGFETIEQIRKKDQFSKLPVIAVTAKAMKGDRERCLEAGFSDYIAKPVDIEQLLSFMRTWMS